MSNASHFNNKHAQEAKKPARFFEDFPTRQLRHADGSHATYKGGKMVPGTHVKESRHVAKVDVPKAESRFFKETPVGTILEKSYEGEKNAAKDTAGEKETTSRVRKPLDVNARALKI